MLHNCGSGDAARARRPRSEAGRRDREPRLGPNHPKPNQSQTKQNQENGLGFTWIPSSDSGLFNGLRATKANKNSRPRRRRSSSAQEGPSQKSPWRIISPKASSRSLRGPSPVPPCRRRVAACVEPAGRGRRPWRQISWVPGVRGHTISRRGINLFKPLRRHLAADGSSPQAFTEKATADSRFRLRPRAR